MQTSKKIVKLVSRYMEVVLRFIVNHPLLIKNHLVNNFSNSLWYVLPIIFQSNRFSTNLRPASPNLRLNEISARRYKIFSIIWLTLPGSNNKPVSFSLIVSGIPPTLDATTGFPLDIASSMTTGKFSIEREQQQGQTLKNNKVIHYFECDL